MHVCVHMYNRKRVKEWWSEFTSPTTTLFRVKKEDDKMSQFLCFHIASFSDFWNTGYVNCSKARMFHLQVFQIYHFRKNSVRYKLNCVWRQISVTVKCQIIRNNILDEIITLYLLLFFTINYVGLAVNIVDPYIQIS